MNDQYIFSGNRHESFPTALFLDSRLTPLERNAWQVMRMMIEFNSATVMPTYQQLQPYLRSMPLSNKASTETVARALVILRLTRWLTLAIKQRNKNGSMQGNVYILNDEPLSLYECLQIEPDYLVLLSNAISHSSKAIQVVATHILEELVNDPYLINKKLPTRLEILAKRLQTNYKKLSTAPKSEVRLNNLLRNQELTSESEVSAKPTDTNRLRNPKSICSSSNKNILLQEIKNKLKLPEQFMNLSLVQQHSSLSALSTLDESLQQQVLDEWQQRCKLQTIHKPAAYLHGIIQKALQGELNLLNGNTTSTMIGQKPSQTKPTVEPVMQVACPVDKQQAQRYLGEIKQILKLTSMNRQK